MSAIAVAELEMIAGLPTYVATVKQVVEDAAETYTFWATLDEPKAREHYRFEPGQINMLGVFGVGEIPISVSSDPERPERLAHTIRICGRVTNVFKGLEPGDRFTVRGPMGRPWPVARALGGDVLFVAGGLGLAPLRPAIHWVLNRRASFRRVIFTIGARDPSQMLYRDQLERWAKEFGPQIEMHLAVDVADRPWPYREGLVTTLFPDAHIDPKVTTVFTVGPEIMMTIVLRQLHKLGIPKERMWLSMERNMHCGVKLCGHCQLGPYFVCADGPIFSYAEIGELAEVKEL